MNCNGAGECQNQRVFMKEDWEGVVLVCEIYEFRDGGSGIWEKCVLEMAIWCYGKGGGYVEQEREM